MKNKKRIGLMVALMLGALITSGCQSTSGNSSTDQEATSAETTTSSEATTQTEPTPQTLVVGVMPAVDSAPIFWAEEHGLFEQNGVDVDVQLFTNAATQQSSAQANQLDANMASLVEYLSNIENNPDAGKITTSTDGVFPIVTSKNYSGSKDVTIGLMEVSVTNFLADEYLKGYNMDKKFINEIPVRMQMLQSGELDMAVLPEPMASNAEAGGLGKMIFGNPDDFTPNVMVFTNASLETKAEAVAAFHKAYNQAVQEMAGKDEEVKAILIDKIQLKPEIQSLIQLPKYHQTRIPPKDYVQNAQEWTSELLGKALTTPYEDMVTEKYLAQ